MRQSFRNRLSAHRVQVCVALVLYTLGTRGSHKRRGLAPYPELSLPTIASVNVPTAAAICKGPASTVKNALVIDKAPDNCSKEVCPLRSKFQYFGSANAHLDHYYKK